MRLYEIAPDADALLALEPEELAGVLLAHFNSLSRGDQNLNRNSFFHYPNVTLAGYLAGDKERLAVPFAEAWSWLMRESLIVPDPARGNDWFVVSRRGARLRTKDEVDAYRHANLLPRGQLHSAIAQKVWGLFLRGDYDVAVFQAFREVEVIVRAAANLSADLVGVPLMRAAFDKKTGPLTDMTLPEGEREAIAHLFAGAIGYCKNPTSHRSGK